MRAGKVGQAEELIEESQSVIGYMNFFAKHYYQLALCYLSLAQKDYKTTIRRTKEFLRSLQSTHVEFLSPEFFLLISKAQIALGIWDDAEITLGDARSSVKTIGSRRSQWQVDYLLGQCATQRGNQMQASEYFQRSKDTIAYILDYISSDDLREHFLNRNAVKQVLRAEVEPVRLS